MTRHPLWHPLSFAILLLLAAALAAQEETESGGAPPAPSEAAAPAQPAQPKSTDDNKSSLPEAWVNVLRWRSIGPANMSGRITALAVYEKDPHIWWAATASGGLLKTVNNGTTFEHQFDREATVSIGDVQVAPSDPQIVWVGTGEANPRNSASWGDGVYKSTDGGATWKNMGLRGTFQIGRIAIHPQDPQIVYVGALGRLWGPNEERGLYKSTDGGQTWNRVLYVDDKTGVIDVQMHPQDPNVLLVATYERQRDGFDGNDPAKKFGPGSGVYLTRDGGATFQKATQGLPACPLGRIGISFSRQNPQNVYLILESEKIGQIPEQAGYAGLRGADADVGARVVEVVAEGPAAAAGLQAEDIVFAVDGATILSYRDLQSAIDKHVAGDKLKLSVSRARKSLELEITLGKYPEPKQPRPRRGVSPQEQQRARSKFAAGLGGQNENMEQGPTAHEFGGVYHSQDGGVTWQRVNSLNPRPMYYSQIRVDPTNEQHVWVLGTELYLSKDGAKNFTSENTANDVHVDHHAMWIDPRDGRHVILGNDGGVYVTHDQGLHWDHLNHVAIGQFYHVAVGPNRNYAVYGGLQDNGSWGGPHRVSDGNGPVNSDWFSIGGGDGFVCQVDPLDKDQVYAESQGGATTRINLRTGERSSMRPRPPRGTTYRFNWKTPFVLSPHNSRIYYSAGSHVFRSPFKGDNLQAISPDITRTDDGTASALAESPLDVGTLYVGTTDGAIWHTRDGGHTWVNLFGKREEKPAPDSGAGAAAAQAAPPPGETQPTAPAPVETPPAPAPAPESPPAPTETPPPAPPAPEGQPPAPAETPPAPAPAPESPPAPTGEPPAPAEPAPAPEPPPAPAPKPPTPTPVATQETPAGVPAAENAPPAVNAAPPAEAQPPAVQDIVSGTWEGRFESESMPESRRVFTMVLRLTPPDAISGSFKSANTDAAGSGKYDAATGTVTLSVETERGGLEVTGVLTGTELAGEIEGGGGAFTVAFAARRTGDAPPEEAAATAAQPAGQPLESLLPGPRWVSSIEPSRFQRGRVYLTCDGHRSDDDQSYVFASEDHGVTWRSLRSNLPAQAGPVHVLREDRENENVLYLGTEFAIFASIDRGRTWTRLNSNLPTVAIHEVAQPQAVGDLVAGTHGRSIWILDIAALRQMTPETVAAAVHLYRPQAVVKWRTQPRRGASGTRRFVGENPPAGAAIYYSLGKNAGSVELRITDIAGKKMAEFVGDTTAGLHRVAWDLRRTVARPAGAEAGAGPARGPRGGTVRSGSYLVTLTVDDQELKQVLTILEDPDAPRDADGGVQHAEQPDDEFHGGG